MVYTIDHLRPILDRVRTDITAIKTPDGASIWKRDQPLTSERIKDHLNGICLRGVCPIKEGENTTRLALLDLDSHKGETSWNDMLEIAQKIFEAFLLHEICFDGFRSSGGAGIHLIAIWQDPQDAYSVRELFKEVLAGIGYKNGTSGVANKEVEIFPKQDLVAKGGCGNQFILPYSPKGVPIIEPEWKISASVELRAKPLPKPKRYPIYNGKIDEEEAVKALQFIDPDVSYSVWVEIGMALQERFSNSGFDMWDAWSSHGTKYNSKEMWNKWQSFRNDGGITIATMYDHAKLAGWKPEPIEYPEVDTTLATEFVNKALKKPEIEKLQPELPLSEFNINFESLKLEGLINDTVRYILQDSWQPQPILALLNTLAFAGAVFGRRYASPLDTRTNIYLIGIADTGCGKDTSRKRIAKLAELAGLGDFIGSNAIRSDTGIARSLASNPCQVLHLDEYGKFLQALSDPKANVHHKSVIKLFMQLYSDSSAVYKHGEYADVKNKQVVIHNPNLCVYGTTTEKDYVKALHRDAIESGELNRTVAIKVNAVNRVRVDSIAKADDDLIAAWNRFSLENSGLNSMLNSPTIPPEPIIVEWGDCNDLQWDIANEQDLFIRDEPNGLGALWVRRHENIIKIAMIFAIARNKLMPEFKKQDFEIAKKIVDSSIKYMCHLANNHISDSEYEGLQQKILKYLKTKPNGVGMTDLNNKFRSIKARERREMLADMVNQGVITIEKGGIGQRPKEIVKIC